MRRAFTLIELVVVSALFPLLLASVWQLWTSSSRFASGLESHVDVVARAQRGIAAMTRDVQQARRLVYPAAGGAAQAGLSVIDGDGVAVLWRVVEVERGRRELRRRNLLTETEETVAAGVIDLHCRVPPVPRARDPDLVHIRLTLAGAKNTRFSAVTSVRPRVLEICCPADR